MGDEERKVILARRARFVAAALAAGALASGCAKQDTVQCLSPPQDPPNDAGPPPVQCLSPPPPPQVCLEPPPQVCLSPPPPPQVCLKVAPPDDSGSEGDFAKPPPGKS